MPTLPNPKWFEALKKDPKAAEAGIHWFTPEEAEAKRAEVASWYVQGDARVRHHLPDAALAAAKEQFAQFVPVGEGPTASDREGNKIRSWLLLAKQSPEELKVALSPVHPPFLWLGAGQTLASLKETVAPYFPAHIPSEDKLEHTVRGFIGTSAVNHIDLIQLHDRYQASDFLDGLTWGSAYKKDPFLEMLPKGHYGQEMIQRYRAQAPEGIPTFSFRSLFTKSILRAEAHANVAEGVNIFVVQVRYHPAKQQALIRDLNQQLGMRLPEDLPVDLAGAFIGLPFDPPEVIRAALPKQTDLAKISFGLLCLDCLARDFTEAEKDLREYSTHAEGAVRQLVANLALRRGLKSLLTEMASREQHPEFKKQLTEVSQRLPS
ncbi:hypothetical protein [Hyalangium minutum]|uniref:Uncharacterized protein n=1 Tax=Hyalangium minutum TaxID=394096 RepID=A0A085WK18_9BACT|nr:hypothetical protein [Hyalangium minutum]KFE68031.1 hypothetical protein DB31_7268 [Hyalangium minutum]